MLHDREIVRCAQLLVRRYGAAAPWHAAAYVRRHAHCLSPEAQSLWRRVEAVAAQLVAEGMTDRGDVPRAITQASSSCDCPRTGNVNEGLRVVE